MNKIVLNIETLTPESFVEFGDVLSVNTSESITINNGFADKHYNLCALDTNTMGGGSAFHIYVAKGRVFPLVIDMLEKHPYSSQAFMPRSSNPFLIVVALGDKKPDLTTIKAFCSSGEDGIHYKKGIWHFPLISIKDQEQFIVLDRTDFDDPKKKVEECVEHYFKNEKIILKLKD